MSNKPNNLAEQNLIFAGLGLQLGILSKDKVIRAFTEWLFDKSKPLSDILIQQKAITAEEANSLKVAVQAHIQKEGDQEKALASLHMVKVLESDLDHLADTDLHQTLDIALVQRKEKGLDEQFTKSLISNPPDPSKIYPLIESEGKTKDRYERQQFFDAGNLGELYFAKDKELNRTVVAKYIKPERANQRLTQALFLLEGEVTGALEHPSIVPVYGLGKDSKGRLFYAMRYIQGRKLSKVIREYHNISMSDLGRKQEALVDLLQYFQIACLAIEYAHKKGVLHCDIKPDNIMIGDYGEVFVVDWGLVVVSNEISKQENAHKDLLRNPDISNIQIYRPSDSATSGLHRNQGGSRRGIGGTPAYMAPEQLRATREDDISLMGQSSDIYALGGVLFQILTGKPPHLSKKHSQEKMEDFYKRILNGDIPKPTELKPETPKPLEAITLKALKLNPEDRYLSARDLADDVKRYLADEPVKAYKEKFLEQGLRFARKNRTSVGIASALLVCLAFGGIIFGFITNGFNQKLQGFNAKLQISEREATKNEKLANENALLAKKNESLATAREKEAERNANLAKIRQEAAEKQLYINKIQMANSEFNFGNKEVAFNQLISVPFEQRGWEHDFLNTLMNNNQITLKGHTNGVNNVCFSPDGKKIVSGSYDNTLKIWDATSGQEIITLKGHTGAINSSCFSPDGKKIVSGSNDNTLKIWDAGTGKEIFNLIGHSDIVINVSFSPDGLKIASASNDNTLKIWDAGTGQEILTLRGHSWKVTGVSFSPDGKKIVSGSIDNTLKIWDSSTGKQILTLKGHKTGVLTVSFSPDGKKVVSGSQDTTVKIWDANSGRLIITLEGHIQPVFTANFSPDGRKIVSGSSDTIIKVWDANSGRELYNLKGHMSGLRSVCFSPDGKRIISASGDKTIKVWDATSDQEIQTLKGHNRGINSVCFSPDSQKIVSGSGRWGWDKARSGDREYNVKIWDTISGQEISSFKGHGTSILAVCFSPDGKKVVIGGEDSNLKLWDVASGMEILNLAGHLEKVSGICFSPDGKKIVSGSLDTTLRVWDTIYGHEILAIKGHKKGVTSVSFSPDGKRIVSGSMDHTLRVWDAASGREIHSLNGHTREPASVCFSPDGKRIVSGSLDATLIVWDAISGQEINTLKGHTREITSVCFSPDGKRIISGSMDQTLRVWDAASGQEILNLKGHTDRVYSVCFSPDGKKIVSGSLDTTLRVWDGEYGQELYAFKGHKNKIISVGFSSDQHRILIKDTKGNIKLWDRNSGAQIQSTPFELEKYKSLTVSSHSEDKVWSVEADGSDVILINNKLREERIARDKTFLTKLAQPDLKWHSQNAEESEKNNQWFAAAFHLRKLLEIEPMNEEAKKRLKAAEDNLKQSK